MGTNVAKHGSDKQHDTKIMQGMPVSGGVSPSKGKPAYAAAVASPGNTSLVQAGAKALAARAKSVLSNDANPKDAP